MENPIGIFDSGIGGLTVCREINKLLSDENIIYFGDTARFPYGTRSPETIIRYSRETADYLLSRKVKMMVIACNTSSATALETLRKEYTIPIIGVIDAGARAACGRLSGDTIGVIGTRATVKSGAYTQAIHAINPSTRVLQHHATLFVSLTEEGLTDGEIARLAVKEYIHQLYEKGVRTLILGCTHFPMMKNSINHVYPGMDLVDTGIEIAYEVDSILKEKNLANTGEKGKKGNIELYASDITETMLRLKDVFFGGNGITINKLIINGESQ